MNAPVVTVDAISAGRAALVSAYGSVRTRTEAICASLEPEDTVVQAMADVSPPKWHLAHTTWFFEAFVLPDLPAHQPFHPKFGFLFNSYYEAMGERQPRPQRGVLSRPTCREVAAYRASVDSQVIELVRTVAPARFQDLAARITLGLHHEEQHQELLLTDILYNFSRNPLRPAWRPRALPAEPEAQPVRWVPQAGGMSTIGHDGAGFCFDNELPRHPVYVAPFELASRLVTNGEYLAFVEAGGYRDPRYWLSDAWEEVRREGWSAPLHWFEDDGWQEHTLHGPRPLDLSAPVVHVSGYEAAAFAEWAGARLPTEAEWEVAFADHDPAAGRSLDVDGVVHPRAAPAGEGLQQGFGDCWEWTRSAYAPYPGYRALPGALGEYNGKFMCSQWVLRGGSCATPPGHVRLSYRNFFHPQKRWQFMGIRLARECT